MIKETKYIIRRILVGVGIVLVLGLLNGCKVKALNTYEFTYDIDNYYKTIRSGQYINYTINFNYSNTLDLSTYENYIIMLRVNGAGVDNNPWIAIAQFNGSVSYSNLGDSYDSISQSYYSRYGYLRFPSSKISKLTYYIVNNNTTNVYNNSTDSFYVYTSSFNDLQEHNCSDNWIIIDTNLDITDIGHNASYYTDNNGTTSTPAIPYITYNQVNNTDDDGVVVVSSELFATWSFYDSDNYFYQYKEGTNGYWEYMFDDDIQFFTSNNITYYFRVLDKNNNNAIVYTSSYSITNIGSAPSVSQYKINYTSDLYETDALKRINKVSVTTEFIPYTSSYKYYQKFVPDGTTSTIDYEEIIFDTLTGYGSISEFYNQNGTLYSKIEDSEGNILVSSSFTITKIGTLGISADSNSINNLFTKISNEIGYGGPVSSLLSIPVEILGKIYSYTDVNSCTPYKLSTLLGTDFYLPCIDLEQQFGSDIYQLYDALLTFILSIELFKLIVNIYNKFVNMEEV